VATKLGASLEGVEFVYEIEAEKLALRFPPSRLAPVKKEAVKQIIYLVSAGRQAAGLDEKTPAKVIRALCAEMGKDDSNFSRLVDDLHGEGLIVGGSGQAKTIRVNADGFERAGRIVDELRERST
jgi:hypothetical protein